MKKIYFLTFVVFSTIFSQASATLSFKDLKGMEINKAEYPQMSLLQGFAAGKDLLKGVRLFGYYNNDPESPYFQYPQSIINHFAIPMDPLASLMQYLFPSSTGLSLAITNRRTDFLAHKDILKIIGKTLNTVRNFDDDVMMDDMGNRAQFTFQLYVEMMSDISFGKIAVIQKAIQEKKPGYKSQDLAKLMKALNQHISLKNEISQLSKEVWLITDLINLLENRGIDQLEEGNFLFQLLDEMKRNLVPSLNNTDSLDSQIKKITDWIENDDNSHQDFSVLLTDSLEYLSTQITTSPKSLLDRIKSLDTTLKSQVESVFKGKGDLNEKKTLREHIAVKRNFLINLEDIIQKAPVIQIADICEDLSLIRDEENLQRLLHFLDIRGGEIRNKINTLEEAMDMSLTPDEQRLIGHAILNLTQPEDDFNQYTSARHGEYLTKLIVDALCFNRKTDLYPRYVAERALIAFALEKCQHKDELLPLLANMPDILKTPVIEYTGNIFTKPEHWDEFFTEKEYREKNKTFRGRYDENTHAFIPYNDPLTLTDIVFFTEAYKFYNSLLPPSFSNLTINYKETPVLDCGEAAIRVFLNSMLANKETGEFDVSILYDLAKKYNIDVSLTEEDLDGVPEVDWPGLKRVIWFYKKYPKISSLHSEELHKAFLYVTSELTLFDPTIKYMKEPGCEIAPGYGNIMKVISSLIPDYQLAEILTQIESFSEQQDDHAKDKLSELRGTLITRLIDIFSRKDFQLQWRSQYGDMRIADDSNAKLTFYINDKTAFDWFIFPGHFEIKIPTVFFDYNIRKTIFNGYKKLIEENSSLTSMGITPVRLGLIFSEIDEKTWEAMPSNISRQFTKFQEELKKLPIHQICCGVGYTG
jgi:hypothetical protein